jgi:coiled-coil domain-containing protein 6
MTNKLQKRLSCVLKEKADIEKRLESEQEYIVNKLQKQLGE